MAVKNLIFESAYSQSDSYFQLQIVKENRKWIPYMLSNLDNSNKNQYNLNAFYVLDGNYANKMALI
jgi:hypothetical protein